MDALTGVRVAAQLEDLRYIGDVEADALADEIIAKVADTAEQSVDVDLTDEDQNTGNQEAVRRIKKLANSSPFVQQGPVGKATEPTISLPEPGHADWFRALANPRFELPEAVDAFLNTKGDEMNDLIDVQKVRHAQRFFETYGLHVSAALLHQSLPEAYACARGAQVLYLTSELVTHPARRIRETAHMLISMLSEDPSISDKERRHKTNLHPGYAGAKSARRVRLFHALVRKMFAEESPGHLPDRWKVRAEHFERQGRPILGKPINQEDQLGTLFTFTVSVFEALGRIGVPYTQDDMDAWFHVWDIVGRHLGVGVESALFGDRPSHVERPSDHDIFRMQFDPAISTELMAVIRRRHQEASHEGKILTNALLQEVQRPLSRSMKPLPAMLIRYLVGNDVRQMLGVRSGGWAFYWSNHLLMNRRASRVAIGRPTRFAGGELSAMMGREILQMFTENSSLNVFDSPRGGRVELPDSLCRSWGIHSQKELSVNVRSKAHHSKGEADDDAYARSAPVDDS